MVKVPVDVVVASVVVAEDNVVNGGDKILKDVGEDFEGVESSSQLSTFLDNSHPSVRIRFLFSFASSRNLFPFIDRGL